MALIKLCSVVSNISGQCGGVIMSRDGSGLHVVSNQRRVKSRSTKQARVRNAFARTAREWNRIGPRTSFSKLWNQFATHPETGYNAFQRIIWHWIYNIGEAPLTPPF